MGAFEENDAGEIVYIAKTAMNNSEHGEVTVKLVTKKVSFSEPGCERDKALAHCVIVEINSGNSMNGIWSETVSTNEIDSYFLGLKAGFGMMGILALAVPDISHLNRL